MKIHLEAHSERGKPISKSGNDYVYISIKDENREVIMTVELRVYEDGVGDGLKAQISLADHIYARIVGEQVQVIAKHNYNGIFCKQCGMKCTKKKSQTEV